MRQGIVVAAVFVAIALGVAGCSWQAKAKAGLAGAHKAAKAVSAVGEPAFNLKCSAVARKCAAAADKKCDPLAKCETAFKAFTRAVKAVHVACAAGLLVAEIGDSDGAALSVAKAGLALKLLYDIARKHGVF